MTRTRLLLGCLLVLAAVAPASAVASQRMPVGFQDDPSFRWRDDRLTNFNNAATTGASIIRTTAYWSQIAPTRPTNATNPFDSGYHFEDLDELLRNAGFRGMTVLITIWGTPGWANGDQGQNHAPDADGRSPGLLAGARRTLLGALSGLSVRGLLLASGTSRTWRSSSLPRTRPASRGRRSSTPGWRGPPTQGSRRGTAERRSAIGETSPRGRQRPLGSSTTQDTIAPGLFAKVVSTAPGPSVRFDAWAHHPYSGLGQGPTAKVAFPNVNLTQLPVFEKKLDQWFKRKGIPIWVTEYGFETKPGEPKGVTLAKQALYAKQALAYARDDPNVDMFIWFIFRDDPTSTWQSGLETENNTRKPAFATFTKGARALDIRSPLQHMKPGASNPVLRIPVWEFAARDGVGAKLGATVSVTYRGRSIAASQPTSTIGIDGYASFKIPIVKAQKNGLYVIYLKIGDANGNQANRVAEILSS